MTYWQHTLDGGAVDVTPEPTARPARLEGTRETPVYPGTVTLRYLDTSNLDGFTLFLAGDSPKDKALRRLGIERREGETALRAWTRAMAEENGIPVAPPGRPQTEVGLALDFASSALRAWVWLLA